MSDTIHEVSPGKVRVTPLGVRLFNATWRASKLDDRRAYWFEFDGLGDLVDTNVPEHSDGPEASALADDCKAWLFDNETPAWG